jgi:pantothenate kinase type III
MQGLVTVDFGNTNPRAGLFQKLHGKWELIKTVPWGELEKHLTELQMTPNNSSFVLSEVKAREEELMPWLHKGFLLTRVKDYWKGHRFAGMPVHYAASLGEDRLIQAFYLYKQKKFPTLLIDAGTYVTMDVLGSQGLAGGYIIPGIKNYFSSFVQGEQLKSVILEPDFSTDVPHETAHAMAHSYLAFPTLALKLVQEDKLERIILSGGDSALWKNFFDKLNFSAAVQVESDLIHWALHYWMTTQIEPL